MPVGTLTRKEATREMHRELEQQVSKAERARPPRIIQAHVVSRIDLSPIGNGRQGRILLQFSQPQRYEDAGIIDEQTGHTQFANASAVEETAPLHPITRDFPKFSKGEAGKLTDNAALDTGQAPNRRGKKREFWPLPTILRHHAKTMEVDETDIPWSVPGDANSSGPFVFQR